MKITTIDEPTSDQGRLTFIENPGGNIEIQNRHGQILITVSKTDRRRVAEVFLGSEILDGHPLNPPSESALDLWKEVKQ